MKTIYLIMGESGCGKDSMVNSLCKRYGYRRVRSYTTRPSRRTHTDKLSHIFVNDQEFNDLKNLVAYTEFDGYRYGTTKEQLEDSDLYIIDFAGIKYLEQIYDGNCDLKIIYITSSEADRFLWLKQRYGGDAAATEQAMHRIKHDRLAFNNEECRVNADYIIENSTYKTLEEVTEELHNIIVNESEVYKNADQHNEAKPERENTD